jgi:AIPR protein
MLEQQLLTEFGRRLRAETADKLAEFDGSTPLDQATALAEVVIGYLEEAGAISEHELCPYEDIGGRNRCKIIGYALADESTRLELFTAAFVDEEEATLQAVDVARLSGRAAKFFEYAAKGDVERFVGQEDVGSAAARIFDQLEHIEDVRIHVLTNGHVKDRSIDDIEILGRQVEFSVVDLERLFRTTGEEVSRDRIVVDFAAMLGRPMSCLEMKPASSEYATFLLIIPGDLLYRLYEQYGPKLLEFNVRSFLQVKGGVNKGIRDTLRDEPDRFLAYNNGLAATADEIEVGTWNGETVIHRVRGLQVVNGGQTLASIHRARKVDKLDISRVAVAMKLTRVQPSKLGEFVPLIAKYANTQNTIQVADLSANSEFHIGMEQLSERTWCPGEQTRWFYERARGSYVAAMMRIGSTTAKRREFERECPKGQRFGKTDLAKYLMAWWQRPHTVSRGAQKNFSFFMDVLRERKGTDWQPDEEFYKETIALALVFKAASTVVRKAKLQSYGAQVTAYIVAKLSADYEEEVDLSAIWENQTLPPRIIAAYEDWAPKMHAEIVAGAGQKNVGEWCKKEDCWDQVRAISLDLPPPSKVAPPVATQKKDERPQRSDPVELCTSLDGPTWARVIEWSAHPGRVATFDRRVAHTISGLAMDGWLRPPSEKQAKCGARVVKAAAEAGVLG